MYFRAVVRHCTEDIVTDDMIEWKPNTIFQIYRHSSVGRDVSCSVLSLHAKLYDLDGYAVYRVQKIPYILHWTIVSEDTPNCSHICLYDNLGRSKSSFNQSHSNATPRKSIMLQQMRLYIKIQIQVTLQ